MIRTRNALCFILFTVFSPHLLWAQPQSSPPVWTVQEAVQFALEHNPDALTAQARISAADADIRAARGKQLHYFSTMVIRKKRVRV